MNIINRINKSKDGKVLIENFLSLSFLQVANYVFPLITLPYLARVIGVDKFGEIAFASAIIVYFQTIVDWGFNYTATRDIAKNKNDRRIVSDIFCTVMVAKFLLLLGCSLIFAICIYSIPYLFERRLLLCITFMYLPGHILFPDWFFQAIEKMKYITLLNVFSKFIFTVLVFLVIKDEEDYIYQPLLYTLGFFVNGGVSLWFIFRKFNIQFKKPSLLNILDKIKNSKDMFISLLLPNFYNNFSVILLSVFCGNSATGIYSSGKKFIDLSDQSMQVLSRTFFPFLARRIDKHYLYVKINGLISIIISLTLFLLADILVKILYTEAFTEAAVVIRIMALSPFFLFLMNSYGTNYLILKNKDYILRNIILYCSIGGFLLSWFMVSQFNFIGTAISVTFIWACRGFLTWRYAIKIKNNIK